MIHIIKFYTTNHSHSHMKSLTMNSLNLLIQVNLSCVPRPMIYANSHMRRSHGGIISIGLTKCTFTMRLIDVQLILQVAQNLQISITSG